MRWVVVGAGTAGCVVTARLAESPDHDVMVVERGADLTGRLTSAAIRSIDYTAALASDRVDRSHVVRRTSGGGAIPYPVGVGVGGSSAVNGMLMERGDAEQYRSWGWHDADEAFARVRVPARTVTDAELGPIDLALQAEAPTARHAQLAADGLGRVSVVDVYLDPAREQPNVKVLTGRAVTSLVMRGDRSTGVALDDGSTVDADAVVLCAGAIGSPLILQRSAIRAEEAGIGLTDHPSATFNVRLHRPQPDAGSFVTTGIVAGDDRVQVTAMSHVGVAPGEQALGAVTVALLRPRSRGSVAVADDGTPRIELAQYRESDDGDEMIRAVETLRRRVAELGDLIDEVTIDNHGTPVSVLDSRQAIADWLTICNGTYVHPAASCPMGTVLDDDGRVAGTDNVYVIDASAFPEIPAAPTYLPTLMLAERLSMRLMED